MPGASNSVFNTFTFEWESWRPLYWTVNGTDPELYPPMSIADPPVYSNGDKTVTVSLKSSYKWSNGQPITANDIVFYIDLVKAAIKVFPADWEGYVPGHFPDNLVSMSEPNSTTLTLNLKAAVNPTWFTDDLLGQGPIVPLPSAVWAKESATGSVIPPSGWTPAAMTKIFNYLTSQAKSLSTYATNPLWQVVDGPYKLSAYTPANGAFTMVPNATYGGPHVTPMSTFQGVPFTSNVAEVNAVRAGSIDVAYIPQDDVPQLKQIAALGYNYFGIADYGMSFANYNFKDTTGDFNNVINQLYIRQALAHLEDEQGWITAFMHSAGAPAYGPIPAYPQSPYLPADAATDPYPFSVSTAISLLKSHGWTVTPGGTDTCSSPGTGPSNCGAGIPAAPSWRGIYSTARSPSLIGDQAHRFRCRKAKQAGIEISLSGQQLQLHDPRLPLDPSPLRRTKQVGDGGLRRRDRRAVRDHVRPVQHRRTRAGWRLQQPDRRCPHQRLRLRWQPVGGEGRGVVPHHEPAGPFQPNPDIIWSWKNTLSATMPQVVKETLPVLRDAGVLLLQLLGSLEFPAGRDLAAARPDAFAGPAPGRCRQAPPPGV